MTGPFTLQERPYLLAAYEEGRTMSDEVKAPEIPVASAESVEFWQEAHYVKKCRQPPTENGKIKYTDVVIFPDGSIVDEADAGVKVYRSMGKFLEWCDRLEAHLYFMGDISVTSPPFTEHDVEQAKKANEPDGRGIAILKPCPRCATEESKSGSSLVRRPGGTWERLCRGCFEKEMRGREPR